jgi:hypothetical protein
MSQDFLKMRRQRGVVTRVQPVQRGLPWSTAVLGGLATVLTIALGLSVVTTASGAAPETFEEVSAALVTEKTQRVLPQRRATIISDSAMAGVRWNGALPGLRGFNPDHRLESCRRLVSRSCNGREGRRPNTALVEIGLLPTPLPRDVLIVAVGYNDFDSPFPTHSRQVLDAAVAKGFQTIAWVTYREEVTYRLPGDTGRAISNYRNMNAELRRLVASGQYPALTLWDLNEYTSGASSVFTSDGVHQLKYGSWLVADWLSRKMAAIDGRPCPTLWSPTFQYEDVCPDPNSVFAARGYPPVQALYGF